MAPRASGNPQVNGAFGSRSTSRSTWPLRPLASDQAIAGAGFGPDRDVLRQAEGPIPAHASRTWRSRSAR